MDAGLLWSLGKSFQIPLRWRQIVAGAAFGAVGACGEAWIRLLFWDSGTKMRDGEEQYNPLPTWWICLHARQHENSSSPNPIPAI